MKEVQFCLTPTTEVSQIVQVVEDVMNKFKLFNKNSFEEKKIYFSVRLKIIKEIMKIYDFVKIFHTHGIITFKLSENKENIVLNAVVFNF